MRYLLALLAASCFAQTAPITIREMSGSTQTSRPITIGRVFREGDIPAQAKPRVNGAVPSLWQLDVRNRWGDGSLKFAVFSFHATLPASTTVAVDFEATTDYCHLGGLATCQAAALDASGLLAQRSSNWSAIIEITNGSTQSVDARTMISNGDFRYWLQGPVVTQVICEKTSARTYEMGLTPYNGTAVAGLHPWFIITAYPNYTSGIREEFGLDNSWTDRLIDQVYSLALKNGASGASTVYSRASFTHYGASRWHRGGSHMQIWDGTAPGAIEINHNHRYIFETKALPFFDPEVPVTASIVTSIKAEFDGKNNGQEFNGTSCTSAGCYSAGVLKNMGQAAGRADIAFVHAHQLAALYAGDSQLDEMFFSKAEVAGYVPFHLREARTDNYFCPNTCSGGDATLAGFGKWITVEGRKTFFSNSGAWRSASNTADRVTAVHYATGTGATCSGTTVTAGSGTPWTNVADNQYTVTISGGTGCTAGRYLITGHTGNTLTLAQSIGTGTGATWTFDISLGDTPGTGLGTTAVLDQRGGWEWDAAHVPSLTYLPYLLTGDWFYYDEAQVWATIFSMRSNSTTLDYGRNAEWGLATPFPHQMRGSGWLIRLWAQAAFIAVDSSPEKQHTVGLLNRSAEYWEGLLGITSGVYSSNVDLTCAGNTPGGSGPTSGVNRTPWKFGYCISNAARSNPLHIPPALLFVTDQCQANFWAKFDCSNVSDYFSYTWQFSIWQICAAWANDAVAPYWGSILSSVGSMYMDAAKANRALGYTLLGGTYGYYPPGARKDRTYYPTISEYASTLVKSGSTTLTSSIALASSTGTFTVADYTQLSWKPVWRRTSSSVSSISVTSGAVTFTMTTPHGLAVGDRILTCGHSNAAFNTNSCSGGGSLRTITAVPSANAFTFSYVGASAPADGSYTVDAGVIVQTPITTVFFRIDSEIVALCRIETNGTVTLGNVAASISMATGNQCPGTGTSRGLFASTAASHSSGATITPAYDGWPQYATSLFSYGWAARSAMAAHYGSTSSTSTGVELWDWLQTELYTPHWAAYSALGEPAWTIRPRTDPAVFKITKYGLSAGTVGNSYSQTLTSTGGTGSVSWSVYAGTLPAGLSLNASTGAITGTPTGVATTNITFRATDSASQTRDITLGLHIQSGSSITISPPALDPATVGSAYSQTLTASGGTPAYSWSLQSGPLPNGISLSGVGVISGTPTQGGTFPITVRVTDSVGANRDQDYTISVSWLTLSITTGASLPAGALNTAYSTTIAATGGDGSYTWTLVGGVFPAGLSLNASTGEISGTPNTAANYSFTLRCTSGDSQTNDKTFTLIVTPPSTDVSFKGTRTRGMAIRCCGRAGSSTADTWDTITTTWAGTTTSWSGT